jgi:hypothetical protein
MSLVLIFIECLAMDIEVGTAARVSRGASDIVEMFISLRKITLTYWNLFLANSILYSVTC